MSRTHEERIADLSIVTEIACTPGNALADEYMRGMANGLILAEAIMHDKDPVYIEAQKQEALNAILTEGIVKAPAVAPKALEMEPLKDGIHK